MSWKTGLPVAAMALLLAVSPAGARTNEVTGGSVLARDSVGDLNAGAVQSGAFPGSFELPGSGKVSLGLGGSVKAVAIFDSDAEAMGADFLPATLGTRSADQDGASSIDATLSRLFVDGRASVPSGVVRGYVEYDLNAMNNGSADFKLRHAYGRWDTAGGTLVAGHTWSTMMDLKILPEGLTEPTVSGVIFMRQPIMRWSQALGDGVTGYAALEDPNSNDVFSPESSSGNTRVPDGILGAEYDHGGLWHVRLNGIVRDVNVDLPGGGDASETAWGAALTGHVTVFGGDRICAGALYGQGLGRYLLGIPSTAGSTLSADGGAIELRDNQGYFLTYMHPWSETVRSSAMGGYAKSDPLDWQGGNAFEHSIYGAVNLMWSVQPYLTLGVEYGYGRMERADGSGLDNHRVAVGVQMF